MKKSVIALTLLLASGFIANACLNHYHTADKDGRLHVKADDDVMRGFNMNFNKELIVTKLRKLQTKLIVEKSYMVLSDYSVLLMKLGKNKEALQIFQVLYMHYPGEYQLAANLGTSYELDGQVDSALKYIRRGMELNPKEHEGSEWIHVKVLETKKKLAADPEYLDSHTVLELTPAQENDTVIGNQVELQVRERFPFCPGPDPIMASLVTDLADITLNTSSIEDARAYYAIARNYFGDSSETMQQKIAACNVLLKKHSDKQPPRDSEVDEGENIRLGSYKYTEMLDDNDVPRYEVDWTQIVSDPNQLLGYVDLELSVQEAQQIAKDNASDEFQLTEYDAIVVAPKANLEGFWICTILFSILVGGYAITLRFGK